MQLRKRQTLPRVYSLAFLFLIGIEQCDGLTKRWLPNTNFGNPQNWNLGRLPCANDVISLQSANSASVFVQTNATTIKELRLPTDGEIVFADGIVLAFGEDTSAPATCGQDISFSRTDAKQWLDGDNWCVSDEIGQCTEAKSQLTLLDSEKIPCQSDHAIFPTQSTFLVDMDSGLQLFVGSLTIAGQSYSTADFNTFVTSDSGRKQFVSDDEGTMSHLTIKNQQCSDIAGCMCGNDKGEILEKICDLKRRQCQYLNCTNSFEPVGSCCHICGAMAVMNYGARFKMSILQNMIQDKYLNGKTAQTVSVSRRFDDKIQVVFRDSVDGTKAADIAATFQRDILKDIETGSLKYGIIDINVTRSGEVAPTSASQKGSGSGSGNGLSGGSVVGIVLALILLVVCVCLVVGYFWRKRKNGQGATFSIFSNKEKNGDMELGASVSYTDIDINGDGTLRGFDNPMYDSPIKDANFFANPAQIDPEVKFNPVYSPEGIEEDSSI
ncbi:protein amnionless [Lingula anatina]|uniref:Protein amnionless n=1 Tax=Lingula anatina TaxID=7574 RepID=A0A1S3HR21_LINAN|nr:protein amnionless [Lingula anatina]|eukprot:XP_013387996.1 protein amnionless [Lingula anatina]